MFTIVRHHNSPQDLNPPNQPPPPLPTSTSLQVDSPPRSPPHTQCSTRSPTSNAQGIIVQGMALVTRFLKLRDHDDTHIFTFVGTKSVTRDLNRDITSKELRYGHHKWVVSFTREQKNLGVLLVWKNISEES